MSSRKGVVLMEELLDQAESKARAIVKGRDVTDDDVKKVALGAIKFNDFTSDRRTNILFNWDSIFALSGFSGPYVQYAAVRVNKILKDNPITNTEKPDYDYQPEKSLIMKILDYPEAVRLSARDLEPHKIATYLYEFARELNRYYELTPVATPDVDEPTKQARLALLQKVSQIFAHGLSLLGIEVPDSM
jgi:arginyl-tRNA synthetase